MEKPSFIENELWQKVEQARDWDVVQGKYINMVHYAIHYKVCALISDFKEWKRRPKYTILEMMNRTTATMALTEIFPNVTISPIPDLIDHETKTLYDVKVCKTVTDEVYSQKKMLLDVRVKPLLFGIDGSHHSTVEHEIDAQQLQDVKAFLTSAYSELTSKYKIEEYYRVLTDTPPAQIKISSAFRKLCLAKTDLPFIPDTGIQGELRLPSLRPWTEIKTLPTFTIPKGQPAPWKHFLIGHEASYILCDDGSDQEILIHLFDQEYHFNIMRENHNVSKETMACFTQSINSAIQGEFRRSIEFCDRRPFGIGRKKFYKESLNPVYERADFPREEEGFPDWIEEEIEGLNQVSSWNWNDLPPNPGYTSTDEMATTISSEYLDLVRRMDVCAHIEKLVTTATKMDSNSYTDRTSVTCVPITTRRPMIASSGKELTTAQFWGIVLIGPHHPKRDTDKIPFITLELCTADKMNKYERFSFGKMVTKDKHGQERENFFLARVNSISRIRLFYYTGIRKIHLQPCNVYSRSVLKYASLKHGLPKQFCRTGHVDIFVKGVKARISIESWIRRILIVEYLCAIYNDSQMEGFLANIRRLHMARHALMTSRRVFTPPGGEPGSKVQETIINNPMVMYMAETWNEMPAYH